MIVPDVFVKKELKEPSFRRGIEFLKETYAQHGWTWEM